MGSAYAVSEVSFEVVVVKKFRAMCEKRNESDRDQWPGIIGKFHHRIEKGVIDFTAILQAICQQALKNPQADLRVILVILMQDARLAHDGSVGEAEVGGNATEDDREEVDHRSRKGPALNDGDEGSEGEEDDELGDHPDGEADSGFGGHSKSTDEKKEPANAVGHGRPTQSCGFLGVGGNQGADSGEKGDQADEVDDFVDTRVHIE